MVLGKGWAVGFCKRKEGVDVEWIVAGVGVVVVVEYLLPLFDTPYFLSELCVLVAWGGCQRVISAWIFLLVQLYTFLSGQSCCLWVCLVCSLLATRFGLVDDFLSSWFVRFGGR